MTEETEEEPRKLRMVQGATDFKKLFEKHYASVFRWLTYLLNDAAVAEDLTQETFLKLLHSPPGEQTSISGWLNRVAANLAFNYLRSEKHRRQRETRNKQLERSTVSSAEDGVMEMAGLSKVGRTLDQLPARERLCLLLKTSGFSYEEIGKIIGVKKSSVGSILARARAKFIEIYNSEEGGGEKNVLQPRRTSNLP